MLPNDDLVASFWRLIPERVAAITELWLRYEQAEPEAVRELKRLLHTMKGEAHMLALTNVAHLVQAAEDVVARLPELPDETAAVAAPALLECAEMLVIENASASRGEGSGLTEQIERLTALAQALPRRVSLPARVSSPIVQPADRAPANTNTSSGPALDPEHVHPLTSELRRLHEERADAALKLREAHRMLRAVLAEIDPTLPPAILGERAIKTVGYGWEVERRLTEVRALWSAAEFGFEQSLESLEEVVRAASKVQIASMGPRLVRLVRSTAATLGKEVNFELRGDAAVDAAVARRLETSLVHVIRNAVDHGIESAEERLAAGKPAHGTIRMEVSGSAGRAQVSVADDGGGIDLPALRERLGPEADMLNEQQLLAAIFRHGFSTREEATDISGRGVGLDVVFDQMQLLGGSVNVETSAGQGSRFVLRMPTSTRVDVVMPLRVGSLQCGLPSHTVVQVLRLGQTQYTATGPHVSVSLDTGDTLVRIVSLHRLLNEPEQEQNEPLIVVVSHRGEYLAFPIDAYDSPRPMALQAREQLPFQSDYLASAVPTPNGRVLLVLDVAPIFGASGPEVRIRDSRKAAADSVKHVVVAEDAPVARELLCGILRSFGLQVTEAADGRQALAFARQKRPDLIMTDLEMPFMGGIELIEELKRDPALRDVPVLVLTTLQDQQTRDRVRALGARGFLTKQKFVEAQLRELVDACLERG